MISHELSKAIRDRTVILFVGAGVSMNLGLPSFPGLIEHVAQELGYDPQIYSVQGDYLALAEYYRIVKGNIGPLRSWMDKAWHSGVQIESSRVHQLIVSLDFPMIYTTNYDAWLERAYEHYKRAYIKIANVGDLTKIKPGLTQIVKFHGDFDDDSSIVLTESSYFERLDFETPLDIKLRSDLLGKSVLFIGYSLSDVNIRYMLYRLHRQWDSSAYANSRPQSFMFLSHPNPVQERILATRGITPLVSESDDPKCGLEQFLQQLLGGKPGSRSAM